MGGEARGEENEGECGEGVNWMGADHRTRFGAVASPMRAAIIGDVNSGIIGEAEATDWRSLAVLYAGNVLLTAGLFVHAFLFNFYIRDLQLRASVMGHQVAAMTLGGLCALLPAGVAIDRLGARASLVAGTMLTTAGLAFTALAREPSLIYAAAFGVGLGGASCRVAWSPAIMRFTTHRSRARALAWNAAILIGTGSGWTYLSGVLPTWGARFAAGTGLSPTQLVLLGGAAVSALALTCYGALPLPPVGGRAGGLQASRIALPAATAGLVALVGAWMVAAALVLPFFNIYFADRLAVPVPEVGALFAVTHVVTAVVLVGAAELARRWGPTVMLIAWMVLFAPTLVWLSQVNVLSIAIALYFVQGLIAPATNPLIDQVLLERTPRERHGIVAGWRNAAAEGAGALGASAGGRILDASSFSVLFVAAGAIAAVSSAVLAAVLRRRVSVAVVARGDA